MKAKYPIDTIPCDFPVATVTQPVCGRQAINFFCRANVQVWAMCETHSHLLPTKETDPLTISKNLWAEISQDEYLAFQVISS